MGYLELPQVEVNVYFWSWCSWHDDVHVDLGLIEMVPALVLILFAIILYSFIVSFDAFWKQKLFNFNLTLFLTNTDFVQYLKWMV